jgi:hypothetical protein
MVSGSFHFILPTFPGHRDQSLKFHCSFLFDLECSTLVLNLGTIYIDTKFGRQMAGILENKLSAIITPDLMAGLSPNFNQWYI